MEIDSKRVPFKARNKHRVNPTVDNLGETQEVEMYRRAGVGRSDCKICGEMMWAEFAYQQRGACRTCVEVLANDYSKAHSGKPHPDFAPDEYQAYVDLNARRGKPKKVVIDEKLRWRVFDRDGHRCKRCGSGQMLRADHIIPESKGGPTTFENLQTLCHSCNARKGVGS